MAIRSLNAILLAALLATGGGVPTLAWAQSPPPVDEQAATPTPAAVAPIAPIAPKSPELSADVVYAILVGEVASQRGDYAMAFTHYLHAAQLAKDPALAERAVRAALAGEDNAGARRAASLWVKLAPQSLKAYQLSAYAYIAAGERERALADLRRVIELAKNPGQGYMQAMQLLGTLPDAAARVEIMRELLATDAANADAQFALATLAAAAEDLDTARSAALQAASLRAGWNQPRLFLVRLLIGADRMEDAAAALDRFVKDDPANQELLMLRAQLFIESEDYPKALEVLERMLTTAPGQPDVLFAAAVVALEIKQPDAARRYLEALTKTGKRSNDTAFMLGQVEEAAGNSDAALAWYAKVSGDNQGNAQVRSASVLAKRGDIARAREIMQALRVQFPDDATKFYLIEAELLREHKQPQAAIDLYTTALAATPDDSELLYARAMTAVGMDRVDLLEADLRRILAADPDHVDALNALGYTLADRTDRLQEARTLIERAYTLSPDEPAIQDSMGWVRYRQGDLAGAETYLRNALDKLFDAEIAAHLGEVLWEQGRQAEASEVWRRALKEAPDHQYLLRVLGRYRFSATDH